MTEAHLQGTAEFSGSHLSRALYLIVLRVAFSFRSATQPVASLFFANRTVSRRSKSPGSTVKHLAVTMLIVRNIKTPFGDTDANDHGLTPDWMDTRLVPKMG